MRARTMKTALFTLLLATVSCSTVTATAPAPTGFTDQPQVQAFIDGIEAVYAVAERCEGFIWRFSDYENLAPPPVGPAARTLSVWDDVDSLKHAAHAALADPPEHAVAARELR